MDIKGIEVVLTQDTPVLAMEQVSIPLKGREGAGKVFSFSRLCPSLPLNNDWSLIKANSV